MIERIVRMSFREEKVKEFLTLFNKTKDQIASFKGCHGLKLLRDVRHHHVLFTYSSWESEEALEQYRKSELFRSTWQQTKEMFESKASAWSVYVEDIVK